MARKIEIQVVGNAKDLERAFGRAEKSSARLKQAMKVAAVGIGAALAGIALAAKIGFGEFKEAEEVMAQTRAGLKSTGGVAKVTAKDITSLASSISKMSGIDDEAVQAGENLLLTFTKVRNEVGAGNKIFDRATLAVADMATKMNNGAVPSAEQMATASIRIGKALNDPVKGVTALTKAGVQFTQQQKDQIKALVKNGDMMGAQKIILAELNTQFGGSAKAAGETFGGQLSKLKNHFDEVAGALVGRLIPRLLQFSDWVSGTAIPRLQDFRDRLTGSDSIRSAFTVLAAVVLGGIIPALQGVVGVTQTLIGFLDRHRTLTGDLAVVLGVAVGALVAYKTIMGAVALATRAWAAAQLALNVIMSLNPLALVVIAIAALVGGVILAYRHSETFRGIVDKLWSALKTLGGWLAEWAPKIADWILQAFKFTPLGFLITKIGWLRENAAKAVQPLIGAFQKVADWINRAVGHLKTLISKLSPGGGLFGKNSGIGMLKEAFTGGPSMPSFSGGGAPTAGVNSGLWDEIALGKGMGLTLTSGRRGPRFPGDNSKHIRGKAIDMAGAPSSMARFALAAATRPGVEDVFYDPLGGRFRIGGHSDHVHVELTGGPSELVESLSRFIGGPGKPKPPTAAQRLAAKKKAGREADKKLAREKERKRKAKEAAAAKHAGRVSPDLPASIEEAIILAEDTPDRADDIAAYTKAETLLKTRLGRAKTAAERVPLRRALQAIREKLVDLRKPPEAEEAEAPEESDAERSAREAAAANLQAQLEQSQRQTSVERLRAQLGEAFIGTGVFGGGAGGAPQIVLQSLVAPTDEMVRHAARVVTEGIGAQGFKAKKRHGLGL